MATDTLQAVRRRALRALVPPPRISLPDWLESTLRLPDTVSATPGRLRLWPFQRGIAEAVSDPEIERVTLVKSVRVGLSTLLTGTLANYVSNEPAPILLLLPTEADCRDYAVSDLEPIFEATPDLRGLLADETEGGRNTILSRRFPGGSLKIVAAKSPRNLRRHNVRILLIDEADAMEVGPEGDPLKLAERRTLSFANRKIVIGSTPILEDTSNVLRSYETSDKRVFEVPCPECGERFEIQWKHIQWPEGEPESAYCVCPHCGGVIEERQKPDLVANGEWRATAPHVKGHAGFRINALVSTLANAAWGRLAAEFVVAKRDPATLQTFVNTILAEGWREGGEEADEAELQARAEPFGLSAIPTEVRIITAGVDVQRDRLECVLMGWTADNVPLVLAHDVFWGDPQEDEVWAELDGHLKQSWPHPLGGQIGISATAVDSGDGETTDAVMDFCKSRFARRVYAIKGAAGNRPAIERSKSQAGRLFIVGVDGVKGQLFKRFADAAQMRFSADLAPVFFEQLTSERRVVRYRHGRPYGQWERIKGRAAEALDCVVYAVAVRGLVNIRMDARENELRTIASSPELPITIHSAWIRKS
ncbi:phage terminase large subunit family protein [Hyphomonas sp. ND6WE1B]|uniref:phage terminase large subunit family protein n=1 Tax=Hyphomonas sp. ND6WE1B TaxID=1848191 RepID=UPI00080762FB|nr:phage terminase large subunit family protein [Hyphomonas sp. ND6WE1B]